jgi:ubiquinone/menaquinone biosynthesis C-methylase UbiE
MAALPQSSNRKPPDPDRELWEGVWEKSTVERHVHGPMIAAIKSVMNVSGKRVLEVGCGSALDSGELARHDAYVYALDYSLHALRHARQYARDKDVALRFLSGDVFRLPFREGIFDLVFSQGLMEHFADPMPSIIEQSRLLQPNGLLCIDVPQTYNLLTLHKRRHIQRGTWFAGWETNYSLPQLEAMMRQAGLTVVASYGWLYFPSLLFGVRNLHTLNERYQLPLWLSTPVKHRIERAWQWLEHQRWYYRWLGCIGVIARKQG